VQIWRPAGFPVVRNTNGREGSRPVCNPVLGPDPTKMMEVGVDGKRVIGIDIGKHWLDVAHEGVSGVERRPNDAAEIVPLVASFDTARDVVVFERCGGYERSLEAALAAAGVPWAVVHSQRVQAFRAAQGIKAKTDAIDARLLQAFGRDRLDAGDLRLGRAIDVTFDALMARKRQLKAAQHAENCRLDTAAIAAVRTSIARMIEQIEAELAAIEAELAAHVAADETLECKQTVLRSQIGVGELTAQALLAELPELGQLDRKEITALGGLAPRVHESGSIRKRRGVAPGRSSVKVVLFNPARTAMRFDPDMRAFRERLRKRGKPGKVIMVAVMRKLLVRLNAILRDAMANDFRASAAAVAS
jgi:transposase